MQYVPKSAIKEVGGRARAKHERRARARNEWGRGARSERAEGSYPIAKIIRLQNRQGCSLSLQRVFRQNILRGGAKNLGVSKRANATRTYQKLRLMNTLRVSNRRSHHVSPKTVQTLLSSMGNSVDDHCRLPTQVSIPSLPNKSITLCWAHIKVLFC